MILADGYMISGHTTDVEPDHITIKSIYECQVNNICGKCFSGYNKWKKQFSFTHPGYGNEIAIIENIHLVQHNTLNLEHSHMRIYATQIVLNSMIPLMANILWQG